ncbi:MAG: GGDEF domain-containing protein, partial [Desulfovibrionales bacterium]|nr:GGDEF domain-containing protein [Desulfovibrionales bacterium]
RQLTKTRHNLDGHEKHLDQLFQNIQGLKTPEETQKTRERLRTHTQSLRETNLQLGKKIQLSSRELFQLRDELEKYQDHNRRDSLTGLINRRGLTKAMEVERIRARQNNTPFSLLLMSIDHFKELNGAHGPLVGDSFLKEFAKILKQNLRQNDIPIRFSGKEFMALLPETKLNGAMAAAGKIQKILRSKEWIIKESGENIGRVTVSMGAAVHDGKDTEDSLLQRVNQALKMAKTTGRNRVFSQDHLRN